MESITRTMDMNNATIAAMEEIRKMRELRAKILMEMQGG